MKKVEEFEAELQAVTSKKKEDILAFAKVLIAAYAGVLALDANALLVEKEAEIQKLTGELSVAQELATEAINKSNEVVSSAPKAKTIKIAGKVHKINYGVNFNGKDYSADELANDEAVVKELIEMGSGAVELNKEDK